MARNEFRNDLYYRLNVFPLSLPPLRERREDIPALLEHFVEIFSRRTGRHIHHIPPETVAAFSSYSWPGNIRELQNLVERAVVLAKDGVLPNPLRTVRCARNPLALKHSDGSGSFSPRSCCANDAPGLRARAHTPCAASERLENRRAKGGSR